MTTPLSGYTRLKDLGKNAASDSDSDSDSDSFEMVSDDDRLVDNFLPTTSNNSDDQDSDDQDLDSFVRYSTNASSSSYMRYTEDGLTPDNNSKNQQEKKNHVAAQPADNSTLGISNWATICKSFGVSPTVIPDFEEYIIRRDEFGNLPEEIQDLEKIGEFIEIIAADKKLDEQELKVMSASSVHSDNSDNSTDYDDSDFTHVQHDIKSDSDEEGDFKIVNLTESPSVSGDDNPETNSEGNSEEYDDNPETNSEGNSEEYDDNPEANSEDSSENSSEEDDGFQLTEISETNNTT